MPLAYNDIGEEKLHRMIDIFYDYVKHDDRINHLFPEDFTETAYKQKLFQTQFLGGPNLYNEKYGHPMLRARHMPFRITPAGAEAWLENMNQAILDVGIEDELREYLMARYTLTANHMVNSEN
ncbi:Group 2 truncated hemoglobin YjbI [Jeotgalicoccus saudimassiliensis]|uniref:Group 2 truncated hemoglobin YjbI n=1 Tax=Jeotgalicoccus saudimassiliensis TaxID=1461582 RepID=A0A078LYT3_9STAP|nr:globin [Jeotgalicoccus saudimassiliensis]CDZ99199.1 Group 2 truncated hemoglobin YjbI [Jeotgalicoccus saudimassiliensis]